MAGLLAALDADAYDVYQPDVVLAAGMLRARTIAELAVARNRWFTPHTWTNGIGLLANLHVAAGVGGGPFLEYPYDPPGWTAERRDFMLEAPVRRFGWDLGVRPDRPCLGSSLTSGLFSGTLHDEPEKPVGNCGGTTGAWATAAAACRAAGCGPSRGCAYRLHGGHLPGR
jgi:hypothetical protein